VHDRVVRARGQRQRRIEDNLGNDIDGRASHIDEHLEVARARLHAVISADETIGDVVRVQVLDDVDGSEIHGSRVRERLHVTNVCERPRWVGHPFGVAAAGGRTRHHGRQQ